MVNYDNHKLCQSPILCVLWMSLNISPHIQLTTFYSCHKFSTFIPPDVSHEPNPLTCSFICQTGFTLSPNGFQTARVWLLWVLPSVHCTTLWISPRSEVKQASIKIVNYLKNKNFCFWIYYKWAPCVHSVFTACVKKIIHHLITFSGKKMWSI